MTTKGTSLYHKTPSVDAGEVFERAMDVSALIARFFLPISDISVGKHDIYAHDPRDAYFSPLDFVPYGVVHKTGRGVRAVYQGRRLISMGFSGFGRAKVKEGAVKIGTAVASKLVGTYRPGTTGKSTRMSPASPVYDQSRVGPSLTSKPKTRGKKLPKFVQPKPKADQICPDGYVFTRKYGAPICELQWRPRKK